MDDLTPAQELVYPIVVGWVVCSLIAFGSVCVYTAGQSWTPEDVEAQRNQHRHDMDRLEACQRHCGAGRPARVYGTSCVCS